MEAAQAEGKASQGAQGRSAAARATSIVAVRMAGAPKHDTWMTLSGEGLTCPGPGPGPCGTGIPRGRSPS
jgi:hypothetical protein